MVSKKKVEPFDRLTSQLGDCPGSPDLERLANGSPTEEHNPHIEADYEGSWDRMESDSIAQANHNGGATK